MDIQDHPLEDCEKKDRTNVVVTLDAFFSRIKTYTLIAGVLNISVFTLCFTLMSSSALSPLYLLLLSLVGAIGSIIMFAMLVKNKLVTAVISRACTRFMQKGAYHV